MKEKIEEALAKATEKWMDMDGVVGVGQGKIRNQHCIEVFVSFKTTELIKKFPKSFRGYKVKVKEVGELFAQEENKLKPQK